MQEKHIKVFNIDRLLKCNFSNVFRIYLELCTNKIFAYDLANSDADIYLQTHTTNPLLKAETIAQALKFFAETEGEHDSLFSVTEHQCRFYDKSQNAVNHNPTELIRTQDLAPLYEENSCLYIFC